MVTVKSHYDTLGLRPDASKTEIDAAWRRAVSFWHPDRNKSAEAIAQIKSVNAARHVLMNDARRRLYDLANGFASPGAPHMSPPVVDEQKLRRSERPRPRRRFRRKRREPATIRQPAASLWRRLVTEIEAGRERNREMADESDLRTVTLFERKPGLATFVFVPLLLAGIFLAALITVQLV